MMSIVKKCIRHVKGLNRKMPISDTMEDYLIVREGEFFRRFPRGTVLELDGVKLHVTRHVGFCLSSGYVLGRRSGIECVYLDCRLHVQTVEFDIDEVEVLWTINKELDNG